VVERLRLYAVVLVGLIIVAQLPLPFRLGGIALGLGALWIGVRLLLRMARLRRAGGRPRGAVPVSVGLGLAAVVLLLLVAEAAYYPLAADLDRCRSQANTKTAQAACERDAKSRIDELVNRFSQSP
jgi:hypothetical protein